MKLSVVTCTYNSEKFLKQTLDSVGSQMLSKKHTIQHVILDGFSHDATIEISNQYKKDMEGRIEVVIVQSPPKGIFNAFNEGVKNADGEYVMILPSDDFLEKNVLEEYLNFIEETGKKDLYYAKRNTFDNELGKNIGTPYPNKDMYYHGLNYWALGLSCYVSHPAMILKKDVHNRFGYYNENLKLVSDWEFYIQLTQGGATSQFYNTIVSNFRVHEGSATTGKNNPELLGIREENYVFKKYYGILGYLLILARKSLRFYFTLKPLGK